MKFRTLKYFLIIWTSCSSSYAQDNSQNLREAMVKEIEDMVMETREYIGKEKLDRRVIEAVRTVPRHEFVPDMYRPYAYLNRPLPIGEGQTISQPYIVALMSDLAEINKNSKVLEVGTGSGYQAAILGELVGHVYTIEIIDALAEKAQRVLFGLGYENITVRSGDGYNGWQEHAPFDAIIVTAAPEEVPTPLIEQLKPGGKLVIPVGPQSRTQYLRVLTKDRAGNVDVKEILPVGFVPLTRD
jgi:protein-L-isoaspartate(D-aspartate) O-methyltransferase